MDFTLTDEQEMLVDTARQLFAKECRSEFVRAAWADPTAARPLWDQHLAGWVELVDGDVVDLALFAQEYGRAVAPGVFLPTVLAAILLDAVDLDRPEGTATVAIAGDDGAWIPNGDPTKRYVAELDAVDSVVVVGGTPDAPTVAVVDASTLTGREVEHYDHLRRIFDVHTSGVEGRPVDPVALASGVEAALVVVAAELVGVGRWLLDEAVAYAKERIQFGRPIGSFQGLQWELVDAALELERAGAAVFYAAMCVDADDADRHRAVHGAKAEAGVAARTCARTGLQVHGGIGYTWEHDLHFRLRRAYASDALMAPSAWHHDRLAALLLD